MDESVFLLNRLLSDASAHQLDAGMAAPDFQQLLLYWLATRLIDWKSEGWLEVVGKSPWRDSKSGDARASILMNYCGRSQRLKLGNSLDPDGLPRLLDEHLGELNYEERLAVFDTLFYRILSTIGINRRHAQITAALANGLVRRDGLIDLYGETGEPFVVNDQLDKGRQFYSAPETIRTNDLLRLRLAVRQIELQKLDNKRQEFEHDSLTLLELKSVGAGSFERLHKRLLDSTLSDRTLVVFRPNADTAKHLPRNVISRLLDDDLLEVIFNFTSYDTNGRPVRFCGWLLNNHAKLHDWQTLVIDTRHIARASRSVSNEQLAWFASAVSELWGSRHKFRIGQFPQDHLGALRGLFSQHFSEGYQDVDGLCRVMSVERTLRGLTAGRQIPRPAVAVDDLALLDKTALLELLEQKGQAPLCAYIIGNNGAGKSLLLAAMATLLPQQSHACVAIASTPADRFPAQKKNQYYRYLGNRASKGSSAKANEQKLLSLLTEAYAIKGNGPLFESLLEPLGLKHRLYLVPHSELGDLLPSKEAELLAKPLEKALNSDGTLERMSLALSWQHSGQMVTFNQLSSGEQQVLLLLGKLVASAAPGSMLLIDEPEISLHVHWQQLLPSLFSRIAELTDTQLLIATHSPTLVANAQDNLSHCFLAKEGALERISADQRHSVETILLEGFETYTPHNREVAERCAALVAQAIRTTNRDEVDSLAEMQKALLGELKSMATIMDDSGITEDARYRQDLDLIEQAQRAILETFTLAREEAVA
ncbi:MULTISPECIES: AAA family ATPase [unclassified Pseudomonas]|uniref:AAA family ATPase n=1 Tax=unclassified Pseudomonas TaxID=196821 RepID=UPI0035C25163